MSGYFSSTVGRKQIMALAGIGLCLFVLLHASGNMFMFISPEAYNRYGHSITSNPLIYIAEAGLIAIFVAHIMSGIILTIRNRRARNEGYAVASHGDKRTSYTTKTMAAQGLVILAFVVLHLITFKYGPYYETRVDDQVVRDLFQLVYEVFQSSSYVIWYIVALLILCFHLSHGLYSSLQTIGCLTNPKYSLAAKRVSIFYGLLVSVLFISQPIYMFFFYKG